MLCIGFNDSIIGFKFNTSKSQIIEVYSEFTIHMHTHSSREIHKSEVNWVGIVAYCPSYKRERYIHHFIDLFYCILNCVLVNYILLSNTTKKVLR